VTFCAPVQRGAMEAREFHAHAGGARRSTAFAASILGTLAETHDVTTPSMIVDLLGRTLERGARARARRVGGRAPRRGALRRGPAVSVSTPPRLSDRVVVPRARRSRARCSARGRDRRIDAHGRVTARDPARGRRRRERHAQPGRRSRGRSQRACLGGHGRAARGAARARAGAAPRDPARRRSGGFRVRAGRAALTADRVGWAPRARTARGRCAPRRCCRGVSVRAGPGDARPRSRRSAVRRSGFCSRAAKRSGAPRASTA
jgi:hypothetical protein